ncbi:MULTISPECIES: hypothetical protein [Mycolicibacterium]|uniref:Uncharacterized protein n=1 Tax=Mycolicibacterium fortuitum TaxID=1766 RepID=A0AAE5AE23_MYCFO|nr:MULTISPECIES: hypothetical protein [Mycolicibacterium]MBU8814038.1 hypothetical protein [Mycolicibacterium goodii]MCV7137706.1 hypothetical protein [Mycolicibacterium fortuitum]MDV7193274.1 hypothetical protein [Mycolicibacterium fortuitum]MDV7206046.1 hypothetical protein [Mycolicibacterium fortuitum]MDV7227458.1 hypothetical protein [Mycolicibacterium fortuitum]
MAGEQISGSGWRQHIAAIVVVALFLTLMIGIGTWATLVAADTISI